MVKPVANRVLIVSLALLFLLTACGINTSGEPEIIMEREIGPAAPTAVTLPTPMLNLDGASGPGEDATDAAPEPADVVLSDEVASADYDLGMQTYLAECAPCHGAESGAGPSLTVIKNEAGQRVEGLSAEEYVHQSIVDPGAYVVPGYEDIMPKDYGERLSDEQINGLVRFIFEFVPPAMVSGGGGADAPDPESEPPSVAEPGEVLAVTGRLIQGTSNGDPIPADQPVSLFVLDGTGAELVSMETTADADHTFRFEDVPRSRSYIYIVWVNYDGIPQGAQIHPIQGDEDEIATDVTLYERTDSHDTVGVTWAQVLLNYAPMNEFGLEVRLDVELLNTGDRIVANENDGEGPLPVSVEIELPVGAFGIQPMQMQENPRYRVEMVDGVPVVKDTWPLRPNQAHKITVLYYLPYENGAVIEHAFDFPVMDAAVLVPNDTVTFSSDQFDNKGTIRYRALTGGLRVTELEPGAEIRPDDGSLLSAHELVAPLRRDQRMTFTLEGRPTRTVTRTGSSGATAQTSRADDDDLLDMLPYFLAGLGVAIVGVAAVMWWRQRSAAPALVTAGAPRPRVVDNWRPPSARATKDELLQMLAALEDRYEAGEIDEHTYQERRAILMDRLVPLLNEDSDA
jgi:mono/diheme cytochrome c family protein